MRTLLLIWGLSFLGGFISICQGKGADSRWCTVISQSVHFFLLTAALLQRCYTCLKTECLENVIQSFWREIWFCKHSLLALNKPVQIRPGWTFDTALDNANGVSLHKGVENLSADLQTTHSIFFSSPVVGVWRQWEGFYHLYVMMFPGDCSAMTHNALHDSLFCSLLNMGYGMGRLIPTRFHPARLFAVKDESALKSFFQKCNML